MKRVSPLLPVVMLPVILASHAAAATIVTNNTGLSPASFVFLNFEPTTSTTINTPLTTVSGIGTITDARTGTFGTDGDANAFGNTAAYASGGTITYAFTELVAGQTYKIYGNWYGNGTNNSAFSITGNAASFGTFNQVGVSAAGATGFTAYEDVTDLSGEAKGFALLGTAVADGNGDIVVVASLGNLAFFRGDAIALAPVPEPSTLLGGGMGVLALAMIRRRMPV